MQNAIYETLRIRPAWRQLLINDIMTIIGFIVCFFGAGMTKDMPYMLFLTGMALLGLTLLYRAWYLGTMEYIVTDEQLIYRHGIFLHATEYMELYRVIDYQQKETLLQQLCSLKTITILSGDRTMPLLDIIGVPNNSDIVSEIRKRVEFNKKRRGVYEITNRI